MAMLKAMKPQKDTLFEEWYRFMVRFEGGYVNDPADPGGETNRGVTWRTFVSLAPKLGYKPTRKLFLSMPNELHRKIARYFWDTYGKGLKNECLRWWIVEFRWGSGGAIWWIQQKLYEEYGERIKIDGRYGPQTATALNKWIFLKGWKFLEDLYRWRKEYVLEYVPKKKPETKKFLRGWRRRIEEGFAVIKKNASMCTEGGASLSSQPFSSSDSSA